MSTLTKPHGLALQRAVVGFPPELVFTEAVPSAHASICTVSTISPIGCADVTAQQAALSRRADDSDGINTGPCVLLRCVPQCFFSIKLINDVVVLPLQLTHWSLLDKLHCLALQTAAVTSTLVLVFYLAYATGPNQSPLPGDYLKYAANVPLLLLDVFFSKVPFVSYHLQVRCATQECLQAVAFLNWLPQLQCSRVLKSLL